MDERVIEWQTYGATHLGFLTASVTVGLVLMSLLGNRRTTLIPFILAISILPSAQRIVIGGLDFPMVRLLIVISWIPILLGQYKGPFRWNRLNVIDKGLITWALCAAVIYILRRGDGGAIAYRAGILLDALGMYFLIRHRVWRSDQLISGITMFACISVLIGIAMGIEGSTGRNYFSIFGSASDVTLMRDGEFRAVASFSHPILAGTFGALMLPMAMGLWSLKPAAKFLAVLGGMGAVSIVLASTSSGPLIAAAFGVGCWMLWPLRTKLKPIRWAVIVLAVLVHFGRERPIWHLILRLGEVMGGGTGYHRYYLIEATVNNWTDWVLVGTDNPGSWGWGLQDITNQWVLEATEGGLLTLLAFNFLLFACFRDLGHAFSAIREAPGLSKAKRNRLLVLGWTQGIVLSSMCVSFISVSLFGQMNALFYLQIALISCFTEMPEFRAARAIEDPERPGGAARKEKSQPPPRDKGAGGGAPPGSISGLLTGR